MKSGKVKVYRGRIMLLGQDRAGKTSLKKSLLGLPFDPKEESTVGVEVDRSKCELEVDEVQNWMPSKRKERERSEFEEELARLISMDLRETEADVNDSTATDPNVEEVKITDELEERKDYEEPKLLSDVDEPVTDTEEKIMILENGQNAFSEQKPVDKNDSNELQLNINSTTLPNDVPELMTNDVTDLVVRYLQSLQLEDDIKSEEVTLTLWDFAGQHLYYASHSVFLSGRAVYILVYNLNKNLLATAEPCVRQGVNNIKLDNANNETNLDNLLSWLVSVHNIRSAAKENVAHQGKKLSYLQPPVIIVGTNLDQPFEEVNTMEQRIKESLEYKEYERHVTAPFFAVDNKTENDEGVQKLRQRIIEILKNEPYMGEEVPLRWFKFERAVDALVAKQTYFMDLDQLLSVIRQICQIEDEEQVTAMLNFYHDLGVIIKHGRTVVLQAQWLIKLFKQVIIVPPFDEADPTYRKWWKDLEVNGILRIALVDHVFSKFIDKGLCKQDILDLMELHGLIAKFSIATDENQDEQRYFVPTQLRSSPSALCEIKPSRCDPSPLVIHFLDGFVPHGLFPQFVSKFIH
ncbi:Cyclic GMP-binding protein C [Acropora cervicornis]|nr:Cyclic GMP-binding protein C [Acropora cervicornis]